MKILNPPKNFRRITPKCCSTCRYLKYVDNGLSQCVRFNGPILETQNLEGYEYVCDYWKMERYEKIP